MHGNRRFHFPTAIFLISLLSLLCLVGQLSLLRFTDAPKEILLFPEELTSTNEISQALENWGYAAEKTDGFLTINAEGKHELFADEITFRLSSVGLNLKNVTDNS